MDVEIAELEATEEGFRTLLKIFSTGLMSGIRIDNDFIMTKIIRHFRYNKGTLHLFITISSGQPTKYSTCKKFTVYYRKEKISF